MRQRAKYVTLIVCVTVLAPLRSVAGDKYERLRENKFKLLVTIATDRLEYFPGELAELTLTAENRRGRTLEVPQPFTPDFGLVKFLQKGPDSRYLSVGTEPDRWGWSKPSPTPTLKMKPGEVVVKRLQSFEQTLTDRVYVMPYHGAAPYEPGEYRFVYVNAQADIRVVLPFFEGMIKIPWPEWEEHQDGYPTYQTRLQQKCIYAFVLAWGGKHYLCVERHPYAGPVYTQPVDSAGRLAWRDFHLCRYSRVAESDTPITGLTGDADQFGNVQLAWGETQRRNVIVRRQDLILTPPQ